MKNIKNCTQMHFKTLAVAAILAISALLVACESAPVETPIPTMRPEMEVGLEEEQAQAGGQLWIYIPKNIRVLDPFLCENKEMNATLSLVYEKLIRYDGTLRLSPSLAESWEPVDLAGTVWRISLRKGASWHGTGDPYTVQDVIFTLDLLKSPEYADSAYAYHLDWIQSYTAIDEYTIEVTATQPGLSVLYALTFPVVSKDHFAHGSQPVGTGPYIMTYAHPSNGLIFEANEAWWRTPPYIKSILATAMTDNDQALGAIATGELSYVPSTSLTASSYREASRVGILETLTQQNESLLLNHRSAILAESNVRKAIAYAIDRRGIITKAYLGHAFATDVPISPNSWLYNSDSKIYDYNPERASALLLEAGWIDLDADGILDKNTAGGLQPLSVSILVNDTPENALRKDVASLIVSNLADVGIRAEIQSLRWTAETNDFLDALKAGSFDMALVGFNMDMCPDLREFVGSDGARNYGGYKSAEMDAKLSAAAAAYKESDYVQAMNEAQMQFANDLPFINLYFRGSSIVYSDDLKLTSEAATDLRDGSPYYSVEKWYFNADGRSQSGKTLEGSPRWDVYDTQTSTTQQTANPTASPGNAP